MPGSRMSRSDEVDLTRADDVEGLLAVRHVEDLELILEDQAERLTEAGVVVDDKNGRADRANTVRGVHVSSGSRENYTGIVRAAP